jgi:hypothetical protein
MNKVLLFIITLLSSYVTAAATVISGKVVDAVSRQPLEAASVEETGMKHSLPQNQGCRMNLRDLQLQN